MRQFNLNDQIMDEAEELALIEPDLDNMQLVERISEIVDQKLGYQSTGAKLAIAAYERANVKRLLETQ